VAARAIRPGDVLRIDPMRVIPLPPYRVEPLDLLYVRFSNSDTTSGLYPVGADGAITLSGQTVPVAGLTTEEIQKAAAVSGTEIGVSLAQPRGARQIAGQHLVGRDGCVALGLYGSVPVAGKTPDQARQAIELHLSRFLYRPAVAVQFASDPSAR
jgi:protein involved in polysaccharide export with SLBB domain